MIASPSDVKTERNTVRQVLGEWNNANSNKRKMVLLPVSWETHSSNASDRIQAALSVMVP